MERNGGPAAIRVPELDVGAPLPYLAEAQPVENGRDLPRLQNRRPGHELPADLQCLGADELALEFGLAVLEQHLDDFD